MTNPLHQWNDDTIGILSREWMPLTNARGRGLSELSSCCGVFYYARWRRHNYDKCNWKFRIYLYVFRVFNWHKIFVLSNKYKSIGTVMKCVGKLQTPLYCCLWKTKFRKPEFAKQNVCSVSATDMKNKVS